jgi:hypothetical protein
MTAILEVVSFAVHDAEVRFFLKFVSGTTALPDNFLGLCFIADSQTPPPFRLLFTRNDVIKLLASGTKFDVAIPGLLPGFVYSYLWQEHRSDGSEIALAIGTTPARFLIAAAPGIPGFELNTTPGYARSGSNCIVSNIGFKVKFSPFNGGIDINTITVFKNINGVLSTEEKTVDSTDNLNGYKDVSVTDATSVNGKQVNFFATVGHSGGESLLSLPIIIVATVTPEPAFDLFPLSRVVKSGALAIPIEFKALQNNLPKWAKWSVLSKVGGSYYVTNLKDAVQPTALGPGGEYRGFEVTQVHNGTVLTSLTDLQELELVVVLHKNVLTVTAGVATVTGVPDMSPLSVPAKVMTGLLMSPAIASFTSALRPIVETSGNLTLKFALANLVPTAASGLLKVKFEVKQNNLLIFEKLESYISSVSSITFADVAKQGSWTVSDNFTLSIRVIKELSNNQMIFNMFPNGLSPNFDVSSSEFSFGAPQKLPLLAISSINTATLATDKVALCVAVRLPEPVLVKVVKYEVQVGPHPLAQSLFNLTVSGAVRDIASVVAGGSNDVDELILIQRYTSGGLAETFGLAGERLHVRVRAIVNELGADVDGPWSSFIQFDIPEKQLPGVTIVKAVENGPGLHLLEFSPATLALIPAGYKLDYFIVTHYDKNGNILSVESRKHTSLAMYTFTKLIPNIHQNQYITVIVDSMYTNSFGHFVSGDAVNSSQVFIHKPIEITSISVNFSSDNLTFKVKALVNNGVLPSSARVIAIVPHTTTVGGSVSLGAVLSWDGSTGYYESSDLYVVGGSAEAVVVVVVATNNTSSDVSVYPSTAALTSLLAPRQQH